MIELNKETELTTQPTAKVRKAFALLSKKGAHITVKDAALNAGCSRSAIYRSELYKPYLELMRARKENEGK